MSIINKKLTFEDYLALEGTGLECRAELIDGELIELPPESGWNDDIAVFMFLTFVELGIPFQQVKVHSCELQTPVLDRGDAANRYPDVVLLRPDHVPLIRQRNTITQSMPPPLFVLEVVSPGKTNRDRDYIRKRAQYAAVGISEYMIVDPQAQVVIVLVLEQGSYQESGCYQSDQHVISPTFPDLNLRAAEIFAVGQD